MTKSHRCNILLLSLLAATLLVGCGSSEVPLSTVEGVILLDGQPLPNAIIEFQPGDRSGKIRPSVGETGPDGKYRLRYSKARYGAAVGQHKVQITTFSPTGDGRFKERVPASYNSNTTLVREVGRAPNWLDFDLQSNGSPAQSLASGQ